MFCKSAIIALPFKTTGYCAKEVYNTEFSMVLCKSVIVSLWHCLLRPSFCQRREVYTAEFSKIFCTIVVQGKFNVGPLQRLWRKRSIALSSSPFSWHKCSARKIHSQHAWTCFNSRTGAGETYPACSSLLQTKLQGLLHCSVMHLVRWTRPT